MLQRRPDAPGQVVVALGEVLLGPDVRRARDDLLGLGTASANDCVSGANGSGTATLSTRTSF